MKRILSLLLMLILLPAMLAGCSGSPASTSEPTSEPTQESSPEPTPKPSEEPASEPEDEPVAVNVGALKGPTAMGMVKLMDDSESGPVGGNSYDFMIAAALDEITPALVQGKLDITAVPANVASVLYNNPGIDVRVLAINTLGVLYIVESGDAVQSVEDLEGKTIYASGKGATPEYGLNYILEGNGLGGKVTLEWLPEHAACVAALASDPSGIAMLPQPFVTTAQIQNENLRIALDLTEEWAKLQDGSESPSAMITGVVIVRAEFASDNPDAVNAFLDAYKASVDYVNGNIDEASELVGKYGIVPAAVAQKALRMCNIVMIEGAELKDKLSGYFAVLLGQDPESVGGALPGDEFYYSR